MVAISIRTHRFLRRREIPSTSLGLAQIIELRKGVIFDLKKNESGIIIKDIFLYKTIIGSICIFSVKFLFQKLLKVQPIKMDLYFSYTNLYQNHLSKNQYWHLFQKLAFYPNKKIKTQ